MAEADEPNAITGVVYVDEDEDDTPGRWSGRFSAAWHRDGRIEPGPRGVNVDAAIAWARKRAPLVSVLVGGDEAPYSAGVAEFEGTEERRWPKAGVQVKPRPEGSPPDGSVQIVPWDITAHAEVSGRAEDVVDSLANRLVRHPNVTDAVARLHGTTSLTITCRVRAGDSTAALTAAHDVLSPELDAAVAMIGDDTRLTDVKILADVVRTFGAGDDRGRAGR